MGDFVASYTETTPHGTREFRLYPDRVTVHGLWDGMKYERTMLLNGLRPQTDKLWYRDLNFRRGIWWIMASAYVLLVPAIFQFDDAILILLLAFGIGVLVGGIWICFRFRARIEYARFVSKSVDGDVPLDIGNAGSEQDRFEGFVEQLVQRIRDAQQIGPLT